MIGQYTALAIQSNIPLARSREEFPDHIKHLGKILDSAVNTLNIEFPVRIVVFPEASFQGFRDEYIDQDHVDYVNRMAIDIPGPETDLFGQKAKQYNTYIVATAKAKHPKFPNRFFNVAFIVSPEGEVVHQHYKCQLWVKEHSTTPHDVYDKWVELYGDGLDAFFPVARLPIGNIGTTICMEGSFPEPYRALAMNGAEIITRVAYPEPWVSQGQWEVQNRARALDNTCYVISPNHGTMLRRHGRADQIGGGNGGQTMIVDYRGGVMAKVSYATESFIGAAINIAALREHRTRAKFCNFLPYLKTEIYQKVYERSIWPKNLAAQEPPGKHAEVEGIYMHTVTELQKRGCFFTPA